MICSQDQENAPVSGTLEFPVLSLELIIFTQLQLFMPRTAWVVDGVSGIRSRVDFAAAESCTSPSVAGMPIFQDASLMNGLRIRLFNLPVFRRQVSRQCGDCLRQGAS